MRPTTERRRRDPLSRVARATYPARTAVLDFAEGFPCNVIGHTLVEVPYSLRAKSVRAAGRLQFKCKRCPQVSGARN